MGRTIQNLTVSFDKKLLLAMGGLAIFFLWFCYYLYMGRDTIDLPRKYQYLFRSTLNGAIFIGITGLLLMSVVLNRLFFIPTPIKLGHEGFIDHRYLKAPIPLHHIIGFKLEHKMVYGRKIDFLIVALKQGTSAQIKTNLAFKSSWIGNIKKDHFIAFDLAGLKKSDYQDCAQDFFIWSYRNTPHGTAKHSVPHSTPRRYKQPPLFG